MNSYRNCVSLIFLATFGGFAAEFSTGQAARLVIGQRTFTEQEEGARQNLLGGVSGLAYAADMLFVVDSNRVSASPENERVLIFKNLSTQLPKPTDELFDVSPCPICVGNADVVIGQPDFTTTNIALTQSGLRTPTSVATDGVKVVIADTDNNRVLVWNRIPTSNGVPADVVIGQPDFTHGAIPPGNLPNSKSMRGPQGVWIQSGKLFVADTQNHRVLIYNSIPTTNGAAADIVLGQPDFNTFVEPDLTKASADTNASNLINPVSATSDGVRLYVTDLGHNRVLIWNSIPTRNQTPADVVVGQLDMTGAISNDSPKLCPSNGKDTDGNPTYPPSCEKTMSFPRYALSDGRRLFVADGGNDRVMVFNQIPTSDAAAADAIIGQLGGNINQASDSADSMRTPMSLAWDGTNLYVSDTFNRRVLVYTIEPRSVQFSGVRNGASLEIFAVGSVSLSGTLTDKDVVTVSISSNAFDTTITPVDYKYTVGAKDTFDDVLNGLIAAINTSNNGQGDPNVIAIPNLATESIILTAKAEGADGNNIGLTATVSTNSLIIATASGATLSGGEDAAKIAPGTIVSVFGDNLSDNTGSAPSGAQTLPKTLANTQVYFDGIRSPLFFVSPTQINAQIPFEVFDRTSVNAVIRTVRNDGSVTVTSPVAVAIVPENPGIFAQSGTDPRPAIVMHGSASASGTISVDGSIIQGDVATVTIEDRAYSYTVVTGDTLLTVRDRLIDLINQDPKVMALPSGSFTRILLRARVPGPEGNGITFSAQVSGVAQLILSPFNVALCCANAGMVTNANPALPGETIIVYATGLGLSNPRYIEHTGVAYSGPITDPIQPVNSLAANRTANVLAATLQQGEVGKYQVFLELNSDLPTDPLTQLTIAQDIYVSNIVTFPVVNPTPPIPTPVIGSLSPAAVQVGSGAFTLTINGSGFGANSIVLWNGTTLPTTLVSSSQLTAAVGANLVASAGIATVTVNTGGAVSTGSIFTINILATVTNSPTTVKTPAAALPVITDAIKNAASGAVGVAPNSWISIYGTNLSTSTKLMDSSDTVNDTIPTTLAGVSVQINGKSAFVYYVSPTQINVLSPSDASLGSVAVTVTNSGGTSSPVVTTFRPLQPAMFVLSNYVKAVRPLDSVIVNGTGAAEGSYSSVAAARPGDVLELFGTGFGPVENQPVIGSIFTGAFPTLSKVTVMIDGLSAPVSFGGLVSAGLYQINITVPMGLSAGDHVVVASIAGIQTQPTALLKTVVD